MSPHTAAPHGTSLGMSLIEACFAVAIIGILTMVLVPPIHRAQEFHALTAAAQEVRTELHRARILAIIRNQDCRLRVTSVKTYLVECETPAWVPVRFHEIGSEHAISANNLPEFHPRGNVAPMATITLRNPAGIERKLVVNRTGRIRME